MEGKIEIENGCDLRNRKRRDPPKFLSERDLELYRINMKGGNLR